MFKKKKVALGLLTAIMFNTFLPTTSFANESKKTIVLNLNRTNLDSMLSISSINDELKTRGYIGLMNIRGDGGSSDDKSYAAIGAGAKSNVTIGKDLEQFTQKTDDSAKTYTSLTGQKPLDIVNLGINKIVNQNKDKGQYGSTLGSLGQSLKDNNIKVSVLGNSDTGFEKEDFNRNFALMAMDENGRVQSGNIDDINVKDSTMPFGLKTDYNKLKKETKDYFDNSDVLFVDLGDTYRLDMYKQYLTDSTYYKMRNNIYKNINEYISYILKLYQKDNIYIISAYPSKFDYSNTKRLSPVIKFVDNKKGILYSATTRRQGIISNVDLGVDILNCYNIKNVNMVGKSFSHIEKDDNIEYLNHDYAKIVTVASNRVNVVNFFVIVVAISWTLSAILLLLRNRLPKNNEKKIFKILKEYIKLGMIMPLAFLLAPLTNASTTVGVISSIIGFVVAIRLLGYLVCKKDDTKEMGLYAFAIITLIAVDSLFGTFLMKNNIMSYDALIGARYYGIGNEYEGVTVASAVFALSVIAHYKKPNKLGKILMSLFLLFVLITSAHPAMGANVGGAICETIAYITFVTMLFDVKIDIKKAILILMAAVLVVFGFAFTDMLMGTESHLSLFINKILVNGPSEIIQTFGRKIAMNIKLAKSSIWVNLLLIGIAIVGGLIFKPGKHTDKLRNKYPMIFKGFCASMVGCFVTLLVNDSGIVAASTASIYILIPLIIILINDIVFENNKE